MKVLHINTLDAGGAANACLRIHKSLQLKGVESKVLVLHQTKSGQDIYSFKDFIKKKKAQHYLGRLKKLIRTAIINEFYEEHDRIGFFSLIETFYDVASHPLVKWADIINLHWIGDFVDLPSFFLKIDKPVVWTCHDMNPMTGGCHYFGTCYKYKSNCLSCPKLNNHFQHLASENMKRKAFFYNQVSNLQFVANSSWVEESLKLSNITKEYKCELIHYPIFNHDFFVINKVEARAKLKLEDKKVVLFVAQDIDSHNKGLHFLLRAMDKINTILSNVLLIIVGNGKLMHDNALDNYLHFSFVESTEKLRIIYNASDVFVIPSIDEAFGQTCLEAMMCGLPVVGFDSGGIPDMIENGKNGYLIEKGNVDELSESIIKLLDNDNKMAEMGNISVEIAHHKFSSDRQAQKYINLYANMIQHQ